MDTYPRKAWKTFGANRVRKISEATEENNITWKHCTTDVNIADLGSRGASIQKTETIDMKLDRPFI